MGGQEKFLEHILLGFHNWREGNGGHSYETENYWDRKKIIKMLVKDINQSKNIDFNFAVSDGAIL